MSVFALPYFLTFFWVDLCNYYCCNKNKYLNVEGCIKNTVTLAENVDIICSNIWDFIDGLPAKEWKNQQKTIICSCCDYTGKYVFPKEDNENDDDSSSKTNILKDIISIIFNNPNLQISIICKKSDKFYIVEKTFFERCPEFKDKILYYLYEGIPIDKNKTIKE